MFLVKLLSLSNLFFLIAAVNAMNLGHLKFDTYEASLLLFFGAFANHQFMNSGTSYGKKEGTDSATLAKEFFVMQKWIGAYIMGMFLVWSGGLGLLTFYNEEGRRTYPAREALLEVIPESVLQQ